MTKARLKVNGMSCQHCVKTVTDVLTELEGVQRAKVNLRKGEAIVHFDASRTTTANLTEAITEAGFEATVKTKPLSLLRTIAVIAVVFASLIGCTDVPYTGPMLSVDHVDRYHESLGEDTICLHDGFDTICIRVVPEKRDAAAYFPIIYAHPTNLIYMFYYEDKPILRAERVMDTTQIVQELTGEPIANDNAQSIDTTVFKDWTIQIYYPDSLPEADRGTTPETSGLDIRVGEGAKLSPKKQSDLQINDFTQINGLDGSRIIQFTIETEVQEITIQVGGLITDHTATFYINTDSVASNEDASSLQLQPLQ